MPIPKALASVGIALACATAAVSVGDVRQAVPPVHGLALGRGEIAPDAARVVPLLAGAQDDAVLLVRQSYGRRYWSLPGGSVEQGESVEGAAVREVKEEVSLETELVDAIAEHTDSSKADAQRHLDATIEAISGALKKGDSVQLTGFGTFEVRERERGGPRPGDPVARAGPWRSGRCD